jgi:hypothetical protein
MDAAPLVHTNAVRIGYARISLASQDHQLQLARWPPLIAGR